IIANLEDLLRGQVKLARQSTIINLLNSQQKPNTQIKEHFLGLMRFFAKKEDNRTEFFRVAYNLKNNLLTLTQLMKELQSYKLILNS
ncbi:hypothetical protein J1N35_033739, partial [Gossypium stocksii]